MYLLPHVTCICWASFPYTLIKVYSTLSHKDKHLVCIKALVDTMAGPLELNHTPTLHNTVDTWFEVKSIMSKLSAITSDSFFLCSGRARPNSGSGFR